MNRILHKKNLHIFFLLIIGLILMSSCRKESFSPGQADSFIKFFGDYNNNSGQAVKTLDDGGYAILGTTTENSVRKIILIRTDRYGNQMREPKLYGGEYDNEAVSLSHATEGGFTILGNTFVESENRSIVSNMTLIRTDDNGDPLWTKNYGGYSNDIAHSFAKTSDGGYILIGSSENIVTANINILLVKTDAVGDTLWTRKHGGNADYGGKFITETETGYIYTGYTKSFSQTGQTNSDIFIAKTNALGRIIHPVTYGGSGNDSGKSIVALPEGGYLVMGSITDPSNNVKNIYLSRIKENISEPLWTKQFGGNINHVPNGLEITSDQNIAITGTQELSTGNHLKFLLETDTDGNINFIKTYGGSSFQEANSLDFAEDGGYIITGTNRMGANSMISLVKTKPGGSL